MMTWRYYKLGGHTHVRVFMNHAKCGDLVFRNEEFEQIVEQFIGKITFVDETYTRGCV